MKEAHESDGSRTRRTVQAGGVALFVWVFLGSVFVSPQQTKRQREMWKQHLHL